MEKRDLSKYERESKCKQVSAVASEKGTKGDVVYFPELLSESEFKSLDGCYGGKPLSP